MWDHVTLRASDFEASARFYDLVLATLGVERTGTADWILEWDLFSISPADDEKPPTRGLHIGFSAPSRAHVDAFWHAGVDAGYRDDGAPGPQPEYTPDYYGGFLRDPDGNSAEAVHHDGVAEGGVIDHLWIRVADVEAAKAFYVTIAGDAGIRLAGERPDWAHFAGASHRDNGGPGERPQYSPGYYGAFALDPDGDNIEAVFHDR
jgi:catechol 2,3-dioxygenase-like lactoylglutathione lyase family enzyme